MRFALITTLAASEAADVLGLNTGQTATWEGVTLDASSVIVKYTWGGDANLDGARLRHRMSPRFRLKSAESDVIQDANLDGTIDGGDYGIIDNMVQLQGIVF